MGALQDLGECCLIIPLKFGVGLIAMLTFANSMLCALALVSSDIRFQPNGYDLNLYYLPSIVGVFGLVLGFVGLLGIYDDKPAWMQAFCYFMYVKWVSMLVAILGDYRALLHCDEFHRIPGSTNVAMEKLVAEGVCDFARQAYLVGGCLDLLLWGYFALKVRTYTSSLVINLPYAIDFGGQREDVSLTWKKYQVKDPRPDIDYAENLKRQRNAEKAREVEDAHTREYYGSMETGLGHGRYGPDGMELPAEEGADTGLMPLGPDGAGIGANGAPVTLLPGQQQVTLPAGPGERAF